ncbi:unnamed protein product [Discosporangium mesarthrocarpum]
MGTSAPTPDLADIPIIDLRNWIEDSHPSSDDGECTKLADALHRFGVVLVRDPRVTEVDNDAFLDQMERYYEQSDGVTDARPELSYQVGVTPEGTERPRSHCETINRLPDGHQPKTICPPEADPKWRFFWRVGPRPELTEYTQLNAPPVVPAGFKDWGTVMDNWGSKMIGTLVVVARMAGLGLGLGHDSITSLMDMGPHLLAPTGSDFGKHGALGKVLAGFHYDLNLLTIHGQSRFPGLSVWLRDGRQVRRVVRVPDGCLLVQAGKQLEMITGGHVLAGFHEVAVTEATMEAVKRRKELGACTWRVSSTCFAHAASDKVLQPLGRFATVSTQELYPPVKAGDMVQEELRAIRLGS